MKDKEHIYPFLATMESSQHKFYKFLEWWSCREWWLILSIHILSCRVIFRDCTIASYGLGAAFSLQILDTTDSYSVFIAFKVTDHGYDGTLCFLRASVVVLLVDEEFLLHCHMYIKSNCSISSWKNLLCLLLLKSLGQTGSCFCGTLKPVYLMIIWASLPLLMLCFELITW